MYMFHNLEFVLYKIDTKETQSYSYGGVVFQRGVSCELELEAGQYAVYVSISSLTVQILIACILKPRIDRWYFCGKVCITEYIKAKLRCIADNVCIAL